VYPNRDHKGVGALSEASSKFGVALFRNSRKTERGAGQFLIRSAVRAAPFALPAGRGSVCAPFLHALHFYVAHPYAFVQVAWDRESITLRTRQAANRSWWVSNPKRGR
jgi:hypothetical protein